jgi:hypothetical protein
MKHIFITTSVLMILFTSAYGFQYWNDIRNSALLPGNTVNIRMENPSGAGIENYILYAAGGIQEQAMNFILDGPSTLGATVPGPVTGENYYGFRLTQNGELDLMPVRLAPGFTPAPEDLTCVAKDPTGDELYGYTNLDLTECRISFSDDSLYAALRNAGGGFPVNQGLTFFGYLLGIANPAQADPDTVWGLLYTFEQAGIISPGLYRIEGPDLGDLNKLGNIDVQEFPAESTLVISCLLSDLTADPHFMAWYNTADPTIGVAGFTQRITLLGGTAEADRSPGGRCYLREYAIAAGPNQLPVLANAEIPGTGPGASAQIEYSDADGNSPVLSEIVFDGTLSYPLYPTTLDYSSTVVYQSDSGIDPLANESWATAVFRFSDNQTDVIEHAITATDVAEAQARYTPRAPVLLNSPNPFSESTTIRFFLPEPSHVRIAIYDVSGVLLATVAEGFFEAGHRKLDWAPSSTRGRARSGVFFVRLYAGGLVQTSKVVLLQ